MELLPELQELTYSGSGDTGDVFTSFIDVRQNTGRPVTLYRHSSSPSPSESPVEVPAITSAGGEARNDFDT